MHKWTMVIDLDKCIGCMACTVACKAENNIPFSDPEQAALGRTISWMEVMTTTEGEYPHVKTRFIPRPCMQCDKPPCTKVCPYTVKYFNWFQPSWPAEMQQCLNPDVTVRSTGVVEKCTFCHHRLQKAKGLAKGEQRELQDGDYVAACVQTCPAEAMYFGDINDPKSKVSQMAKSSRAFRMLEDLGTEPKVIYLTEGEWYGVRKD